jgi:plastocyanin
MPLQRIGTVPSVDVSLAGCLSAPRLMKMYPNNLHAILLALAFAACSVQAVTNQVTILSSGFSPASKTINAGDSIRWVNLDDYEHTTVSDTGLWNSGILYYGGSYTVTFNTPGTYGYYDQFDYFTGTIVVNSANTPPTVSITSPTNNAVILAHSTLTVQASASDAGGSITNVQFFLGAISIGNDVSSPYSASVTNVAAGTYTVSAVATDNSGAKATNSISIIVNAAPTGNLTSLTNGAVFACPANLSLVATASDSDGTVTNVQFFVGGVSVGSDATSPYSTNVLISTPGSYAIGIGISDNRGAVHLPAAITVNIVTNAALSGMQRTSGQFRFDIKTVAGQNYVVEASTNLVNWTALNTNAAAGTTFSFTDSASASYTNRFYRVRSQ